MSSAFKKLRGGVIVKAPLNDLLQLRCTTAGTTSASTLNCSSNKAGDSITDGSVVWAVESLGTQFALASHNHSASNITSGAVPVANGGTGATTAKQARENLEVEPIGTIFAFAGNDIPAGYLPCNGSAISRETYADLFAVIGTTYGSGDGSTTFNLPNLTDKFIQGSDTAGTVKSAGLPNIGGSSKVTSLTVDVATNGAFYSAEGEAYTIPYGSNYTYMGYRLGIDASRYSSIYGNSNTVQPPALTMRYIIKY